MPSLHPYLISSISNLKEQLEQLPSGSIEETLEKKYCLTIYQNLNEIQQISDTEEVLKNNLQTYFEKHWQLIRKTSFCYTAKPDLATNACLIKLAEKLSEQPAGEAMAASGAGYAPDTAPLSILMPGITLNSLNLEKYPDLGTQTLDITSILKSHVIAQDGDSLIPVAVLLEHERSDNAKAPFKPYYDYRSESSPELKEPDLYRLYLHSNQTKAFMEARALFLDYTRGTHLLGQLNTLLRQMYDNSVHKSGSVHSANIGAYPAIAAFFQYYDSLDKEKIASIPTSVKDQLGRLRQSTEPCIATQRAALKDVIQSHEATLAGISIDGELTAKTLIEDAEIAYNQALQDLKQTLEDGTYHGHDSLPLTQELLDNLDFTLTFQNEEDIERLITSSLSVETMILLFKNRKTQETFLNVMGRIDAWARLITAIAPHKLEALLNILPQALVFERLMANMQEFFELLQMLSIEQFNIVFHAIDLTKTDYIVQNTLLHIIAEHEPGRLAGILKSLPESERETLLSMKNYFGETVLHRATRNLESLKIILLLYPESERLKALKNKDASYQTVLDGIDDDLGRGAEKLKFILELLPKTALKDPVITPAIRKYLSSKSDNIKYINQLYIGYFNLEIARLSARPEEYKRPEFFRCIGYVEYSKTEKIEAAKTLIYCIENDVHGLTPRQVKILQSGEVGKIASAYAKARGITSEELFVATMGTPHCLTATHVR